MGVNPSVRDLSGVPLIVGGGLAGMMTALSLPGPCVLLLAPDELGQTVTMSSALAQGGIAAAVGPDDSAALHIQDTLLAGDGLCDPQAVSRILQAGPAIIENLRACGVPFDCDADGVLALGLEAAHSRARICHAGGDRTGAAVVSALLASVRATSRITVLHGSLRSLTVTDGQVSGWTAVIGTATVSVGTPAVVLATGGVGGLFPHATNPRGLTGTGLAIAARAGARLGDLEFVQFHPTALNVTTPDGRLPLVSEAVRGEGAVLIDEAGHRFTDELLPRDVVSRAIAAHIAEGHSVFLDARRALGNRFATRFPGIDALCQRYGIDPSSMPIPVRPAVHYHMGGIVTDADGRSTVPGLWACGEVACTGLHGANRLASNSLLEAAVMGRAVAEDIAGRITEQKQTFGIMEKSEMQSGVAPTSLATIRGIVGNALDIRRDGAGLRRAIGLLRGSMRDGGPQDDAAIVALMMAHAALLREESRGAHARMDFPATLPIAVRRSLSLHQVLGTAPQDVAA